MRPWIALLPLALVLASASAAADPFEAKALSERFAWLTQGQAPRGGTPDGTPPRFAFTDTAAAISPASFADCLTPGNDFAGTVDTPVIGKASDGKSAWIATDVTYTMACGMEGCDKIEWPLAHGTAVFDAAGHAFAWHVGMVTNGSQAPKRGKPVAPKPLPDGIDAGAEAPAKLFKTSLADPRALAKTVSDRADVVLFGSDAAERYVGGAAVRARLAKWNLGFSVRDGIQAGVTPSKAVAWVAANVDAAKPGDKKSTPYRVFAVYEKTASAWQLVVLHFSTVTS
jgi:hypothetical protein